MQAIEDALFNFKEFNILDIAFYQFLDCTLKVDIGKIKTGDVVDIIEINYETSTLEIYNVDNEQIVSAKISLALSDVVDYPLE